MARTKSPGIVPVLLDVDTNCYLLSLLFHSGKELTLNIQLSLNKTKKLIREKESTYWEILAKTDPTDWYD